jgi:hypothetical protein
VVSGWVIIHTGGIALICRSYYHYGVELMSLKLPSGLRAKVAAEARRRNVSQSTIIRESLERSLATSTARAEVSCADLAGNLAGSFRSGRRDLSANKELLTDAIIKNARRGRKRHR